MRKIIITVIATFFMIAPFEKAKGQWEAVVTSADFPTANVLIGANTKLSFGLGRLEPFIQIAPHLRIFEESMTLRISLNEQVEYREYRSPRLATVGVMNVGIKLRITDSDYAIVGLTGNNWGILNWGTWERYYYNYWHRAYLGYIRRERLSRRVSADLSALFSPPLWGLADFRMPATNFEYGALAIGAGLNYEIFNNFKLTLQLMYLRKFAVEVGRFALSSFPTNGIITRNLVEFSIGIHYRIPIYGEQQQQPIPQRPPRQRVAPHQRALPCPPGQMRHSRSWDRPSSVFNHPTAR